MKALRLGWQDVCARVVNRLGWPCLVRPCEYSSNFASVSVKCTNLFTVVIVNGVHVYFHRGTGTFDGVGIKARD
jgi:hypothetical protein